MSLDGVRPNLNVVCPVGHTGSMTDFGMIYECHTCGPYKFWRNNGVPEWTEPNVVPLGLRSRMTKASAAQRSR